MTAAPKDRMWAGRFERPPNETFDRFQRSWSFDRRLLPYPLAIDRTWARALGAINILAAGELEQILSGLGRIEERAAKDSAWLEASKAEDVHHFVELELTALLGPAGAKLHTGRSRNELVVTAFRMFIRDAAGAMRRGVAALIAALGEQAERHFGVPMPGNTHLQRAQPVLFSHYLLAHAEAFFHDLDRLGFAANTANACPMGAGALAGSAFPVDRAAIARELDSVSRRDFALDYLYALAVLASHLSRLAEDFTLFATQEFGWLELADEFSTGSSLMPQKKNPDAWELIRGKAGRVTAALVSLLLTLKGLPTGYQRDLQEDKEPVFAAHDQAIQMTEVAAGAVAAMNIHADRMRAAASDSVLLATEAADYLVARGVPFRQAHEIVARICRDAEAAGQMWNSFPLEKLRSYSTAFGDDLAAGITLEAALARRSVPGGTAPEAVRASLKEFRTRLRAIEESL
jgi:argininosuccinate lyase